MNATGEDPRQVMAELALKVLRNWVGTKKRRHLGRERTRHSFIQRVFTKLLL